MLICDICGNEIEGSYARNKMKLKTKIENGYYVDELIDICDDCTILLKNAYRKAEYEFFNKNKKVNK